MKRRERWLVILGVILHAVYMLSIFDIYFKTPIVHGMDPVKPRFKAPAKRLVLLVGMIFYQVLCLVICLCERRDAFLLTLSIPVSLLKGTKV